MGIENMRRWPMYIVFAVCILLTLSLFNSWSLETELRNRLAEISVQLRDCTKQQTTCMEDSLSLLEQKEGFVSKVNDLEKKKNKLVDEVQENKNKAVKAEILVNRTLSDVDDCKTELRSIQNTKLSMSATMETLRLENSALNALIKERKAKLEELEKEVERLKSALTTKSAPNPAAPAKVTPAAAPPKQSPPINPVVNNPPINEPVLENNDAKEDFEDTNMINDGDGFDPQINN